MAVYGYSRKEVILAFRASLISLISDSTPANLPRQLEIPVLLSVSSDVKLSAALQNSLVQKSRRLAVVSNLSALLR